MLLNVVFGALLLRQWVDARKLPARQASYGQTECARSKPGVCSSDAIDKTMCDEHTSVLAWLSCCVVSCRLNLVYLGLEGKLPPGSLLAKLPQLVEL